ncbi:glycosyltransferase family 4 protein [Solimonas marina]|uniref:Glycosyltransferase family 4 protein n=1 Tax=Solimonas marina TaxID=2714601 RepID=A0A969W6P0_9GAMM|nr:glycosyltransferase family 4 protein [Solimonas marina]NKF21656.1 glycosyltransferase family 4 protein [Solimonas marina]
MLKVMHVEAGENFYGGARQVAFLVDGLARRGIANVVVCPRRSLTARRIAELPVTLREIPMAGDLDLPLLFRLRRLLRDEKPDLLHLHSRRGPEILGGLAGRWHGLPIVYSRRNDHYESPAITRYKYRLYDRVVAISQCIGDVLKDSGVPPAKIRVVRSAFTPEAVTPLTRDALRDTFGLPRDAFVVAIVAQLIRRKGHAVLLDAMPRLLRDIPNLHVLFFGKGGLQDELQQRVDADQLGERVKLAGYREDLPQLLEGLDLLIHPAFAEGLGVSLLQASANGVAIVASRAGGIPEAVRDGVNGVLVPPHDVDALAEAITALAHDDVRRQALGAAGRRLIADEFSVDAMVEGNLAVYRELLGDAA